MKAVAWIGSSKADLMDFSASAQSEAGHQLFRVQCGLEPNDWKPMPSIGAGVKEIRVRDASGAFRIIYLATRPEAIYVLHCFQKKTQRTSQHDLRIAEQRFRDLTR